MAFTVGCDSPWYYLVIRLLSLLYSRCCRTVRDTLAGWSFEATMYFKQQSYQEHQVCYSLTYSVKTFPDILCVSLIGY